MNTTGTIIGHLDAWTLKELLLNYKGSSDNIKKMLLDWYDEAKKLESEDPPSRRGLIISRPEGL